MSLNKIFLISLQAMKYINMYTKEQLPGMVVLHKDYVKAKNPCLYHILHILPNDRVALTWKGCITPRTNYMADYVIGLLNEGIWVEQSKIETLLNYSIY